MASLQSVKPVNGDSLKSASPGSTLRAPVPVQYKTEPSNIPIQNMEIPPEARQAASAAAKEKEVDFTDPSVMFDYVLYYHLKSKPSMTLYSSIVEDSNLKNMVWLQNITHLSDEELTSASWCNGVPILVNKRSGEAFRGAKSSFSALQGIPRKVMPSASNAFSGNVNPSFGLSKN